MPDEQNYQVPFGFKIDWIAARSVTVAAVAGAIGLTQQEHMNWAAGVNGPGVFVCPPVDGWTLAVGGNPLGPDRDLGALSERLATEVQYFGSHRVVGYCKWARAESGVVLRDFEYVGDQGEIVKNEGMVTEVEEDTDGAYDVVGMPEGPVLFDPDEDVSFPTEETVLEIAGAWSIDPSTLQSPDDRLGILGDW